MKQIYKKPVVNKIELNYEQAVLGSCSGIGTAMRDSASVGCKSNCRGDSRSGGTDREASS